MAWLKLEARYPHHPKIRRAGLEAMGLDVAAMCHCREFGTEGLILDSDLSGLAPAPVAKLRKLAAALVSVGRWDRDDEVGGWWLHGFTERNPQSDAETTEMAAAARRVNRARAAATARWAEPKKGKPGGRGPEPDAQSDAWSNAQASPSMDAPSINEPDAPSIANAYPVSDAQAMPPLPSPLTNYSGDTTTLVAPAADGTDAAFGAAGARAALRAVR